MKRKNQSNVLLVEILIVVLFFMLSATVLVRVFIGARNRTVRAGVEAVAVNDAQNVAETLYAAKDIDQSMKDMGFLSSHGAWTKDCGDYTLYVKGEAGETGAGTLWTGEVSAFYKLRNPDKARQEDEELFTLPCTRYEGGERQ
ncbi:MAG: type II secretion system protein [Clostridia bacterium]|nr:type II secretion system protein [Clostridia bacterium]